MDLRYEGHLVILGAAKHNDASDLRSITNARVDIQDEPDGWFEVLYKGKSLPHRIFNKAQRVNHSDVVENKMMGAALEMVPAILSQREVKRSGNVSRRTYKLDICFNTKRLRRT